MAGGMDAESSAKGLPVNINHNPPIVSASGRRDGAALALVGESVFEAFSSLDIERRRAFRFHPGAGWARDPSSRITWRPTLPLSLPSIQLIVFMKLNKIFDHFSPAAGENHLEQEKRARAGLCRRGRFR